jgi:hypothetical protein
MNAGRGPGGPGAPASPLCPIGPGKEPGVPSKPGSPCGPGGPVTPCGPSGRTTKVEYATPANTAQPTNPITKTIVACFIRAVLPVHADQGRPSAPGDQEFQAGRQNPARLASPLGLEPPADRVGQVARKRHNPKLRPRLSTATRERRRQREYGNVGTRLKRDQALH